MWVVEKFSTNNWKLTGQSFSSFSAKLRRRLSEGSAPARKLQGSQRGPPFSTRSLQGSVLEPSVLFFQIGRPAHCAPDVNTEAPFLANTNLQTILSPPESDRLRFPLKI